MFHRCLSILILVSLTASGGAAWATSVFVDISAKDGYVTARPNGVAPSGYTEFQTNITGQTTLFYSPNVYSGGTNGTVTNLLSSFTGAARIASANMNGSGQFIGCQTSPAFGSSATGGWYYAGGTATSLPIFSGTYETYGVAIDNNGDTAGFTRATGGGDPAVPFVRTGGTYYHLTAGNGIISALNTSGQAVGWNGSATTANAQVWTYTISGGSVTAQSCTDLQSIGGGMLGTGGAVPKRLQLGGGGDQ